MGNKSYDGMSKSSLHNHIPQKEYDYSTFSENPSSHDNFEFLHKITFKHFSDKILNKAERQKIRNSFVDKRELQISQKIDVKLSSKSNILNKYTIPFYITEDQNSKVSQRTTDDSHDKDPYDGERENFRNDFEHINYESITKARYESHKPFKNSLITEIPEDAIIEHSNSCVIKEIQVSEYELKMMNINDKLRKAFISKLITMKAWQPTKKEKKYNSMIIFDWDDTLLCTSYLTPSGIFNEEFELSKKDKEKLSKLEVYVLKLLNFAIEKSQTFIITNAAPGWVEFSCRKFYPEVFRLLPKITIVSARGDYEKIFPNDIKQWKIQAFLHMRKNFDSELVSNIICMGDSVIEIEAAHILASKFTQAYIKTIKFRETPKPEELVKQLSLINEQFPNIYSSVKNLTIRVEKKGFKDK